jgi:hypothetical protein
LPGVTHDRRPDLDQFELEVGERSICHFFGQRYAVQDGGQVVSQGMQPQQRPAKGILDFLDVLLGGAAAEAGICHVSETTIAQLPDPSGFTSGPFTDMLRDGARKLIEQAIHADPPSATENRLN